MGWWNWLCACAVPVCVTGLCQREQLGGTKEPKESSEADLNRHLNICRSFQNCAHSHTLQRFDFILLLFSIPMNFYTGWWVPPNKEKTIEIHIRRRKIATGVLQTFSVHEHNIYIVILQVHGSQYRWIGDKLLSYFSQFFWVRAGATFSTSLKKIMIYKKKNSSPFLPLRFFLDLFNACLKYLLKLLKQLVIFCRERGNKYSFIGKQTLIFHQVQPDVKLFKIAFHHIIDLQTILYVKQTKVSISIIFTREGWWSREQR